MCSRVIRGTQCLKTYFVTDIFREYRTFLSPGVYVTVSGACCERVTSSFVHAGQVKSMISHRVGELIATALQREQTWIKRTPSQGTLEPYLQWRVFDAGHEDEQKDFDGNFANRLQAIDELLVFRKCFAMRFQRLFEVQYSKLILPQKNVFCQLVCRHP